MQDRDLEALRDALRVSPDNIPLRLHLGDALTRMARHGEAIEEYRKALALAPRDEDIKRTLAEAYFSNGQTSEALVIVEDLIRTAEEPAPARLLHARILLAGGDAAQAVREYRRAIDEDPDVADPELADRLGIDAGEDADVIEGQMRLGAGPGPGGGEIAPLQKPKTRFDDVGGMEPLKEEIRMKVIHPMTHRDLFKAYGKSVGGGVLLYGPPGCGKTHLARATAGEVDAAFLSVGIHEVLDMWIGSSEQRMHGLFETARQNAPCVLFFDEVDALGARRSDMQQSGGRHVINQFLAELDGIGSDNEGVLVLAATNSPWHLDPAFRRPGRFDRVIFVPPPDVEGLAAIFAVMLRDKPTADIDHRQVAGKCAGLSGADVKAVVDRAVEAKLAEAMRTGRPEPLRTKDLLAARKAVKPTTREWFQTARNYALYSNEGGIYDDLLPYIDR